MIRPASRDDLTAITALDARAYGGDGYGPYVVRQLFDLSPTTMLVAERDGDVVGYSVGAVATDGHGWLLSVATDPSARGLGLGRALTLATVRALAALGADGVRLTVAPTNAAARALYAALGFVETGREPDYYGPGEDRLLMVLAPTTRLAP